MNVYDVFKFTYCYIVGWSGLKDTDNLETDTNMLMQGFIFVDLPQLRLWLLGHWAVQSAQAIHIFPISCHALRTSMSPSSSSSSSFSTSPSSSWSSHVASSLLSEVNALMSFPLPTSLLITGPWWDTRGFTVALRVYGPDEKRACRSIRVIKANDPWLWTRGERPLYCPSQIRG